MGAVFPFVVLATVLGSVFGSFLTCALYRVPRGLSLWAPPSACPRCHTTLKAPDLVPVLSWVFSSGKCRHCAANISPRYPLTELFSVALALLALWLCWLAGVWYILFLPLYAGFMAFSFAAVLWWQQSLLAGKSVAFGLLCLAICVAFSLA